MPKKKKITKGKNITKRDRLAHLQYFYVFAALAVGSLLLGFIQPSSSSQKVLGAHTSALATHEDESVSVSLVDFGEAVWYNLLNLFPLR